MTNKEYNKLHDLYQDVIQGLNADLETGSHHWNNQASASFISKHKYFMEAFDKLYQYIESHNPDET